MKQYLYKNRNTNNYQLFPVDDIHKTAFEYELIGDVHDVVEQRKNLVDTNAKLESFIKSQPLIS